MKKILLIMVCLVLILFSGCLKIRKDDKKDGATDINITAELPYAIDVFFSGCKAELEYDEGMTVTAEPSGPVDGYRWFLDDDELEEETGATVEVRKDIEPGKYRLDLFVTKGEKIIGSGSVIFYKKDNPNKDTSLEGTWCVTEVYITNDNGDEIFRCTYPDRRDSGEIIKVYFKLKKNGFKSFIRIEDYSLVRVDLVEEAPYHLEENKIVLAKNTNTLGKEATYSIEGMNGEFIGTDVVDEPDYHAEFYVSIKAVKANDGDVVGAVSVER